MSPLLGRDRDVTGATGHTDNGFATLLSRKNESVRSDTAFLPLSPIINSATSSITSYWPCLEVEVNSSLCLPRSSPVLQMQYLCFYSGSSYTIFYRLSFGWSACLFSSVGCPTRRNCHATFKTPVLDTANMNNYRPVSNQSFMPKLTERVKVHQLTE
jgi:hypothetical protein